MVHPHGTRCKHLICVCLFIEPFNELLICESAFRILKNREVVSTFYVPVPRVLSLSSEVDLAELLYN